MSTPEVLFSLTIHFILVSLLAVGGASTALPDLHHYLVETNNWMSDAQFTSLYAVAQVAPGPNVLFVALFGWQVAGVAGAAVSIVGMCGPSSLLCLAFEVMANQRKAKRWPSVVRRALAPLSIGLLLSTGWILSESADKSWPAIVLTTGTVVLSIGIDVHPLWMIALGAIVGAISGIAGWP